MKNQITEFNDKNEADRISFVLVETAAHFAMKGILHYPDKEMGIYYRRSVYANCEIIEAIAFVWNVTSIHNIMQQCCK